MMNQYNKETAQIHAPADLIRRTKEAVREEEQRIMREQLQQNTVMQPKHSYAKVYRWALPVAAAIFCVIIINVGLLRPEKGMSGAATGASMDTASGGAELNDMELQFAATAMYEESAEAAEEPADKGGAYDMSAGAATDAGTSVTTDTSASVATDASAAAEDDGHDAAAGNDANGITMSEEVGKEQENGYIDSIYGNDLWIEKVNKAPSFYHDSDTRYIDLQGFRIYVAPDVDNTWIGYARKNGQRYLISGAYTEEDMSWEEFAEKAYELLSEAE